MGLFDKFKNKRSDDNLNIEIPVNVKLIGPIDECTNNSIYVPQTKHTYEIKIPNNIEKGYRMRLKGCGLSSPKGYAGDLVLIITNIECNDITINKSILFTEIDKDILINIPHLNRNINVTIPSSLKSKDVFTLRLKGLGLSNDYGEIGNLFIKTSVIKSKEEYDACCEYPELNSLIGLTNIKKEVSNMANLINMQTQRAAQGLKSVPISRHCVFTGNPGTGKTTVARIMANIYKNMGVLSKGQLIEVDRSKLVSQYIGETAIKTQEKINEAIGGILFIDEAYALVKDGKDFGQEAIDTILKAMEDYRNDFIVIVAGYEDLMKNFIDSNPGLKSRFSKYFKFPDYSADELIDIFYLLCDKYDYKLTSKADSVMKMKINHIESHKTKNFANAREIRNLFEKVITKQATRISVNSSSDITLITEEDFFDIV